MALILAADDEEAYLEVLADVLTLAGHQCLKAHDGEEALALARQHRPDLIVTDHMMPRLTGIELLHRLHAEPALAAIPTILVSAIRPERVEAATRFLGKPVHVDQIQRAVDELLSPGATATSRGSPATDHVSTREEALNWVAHEIKNPLGVAMMNTELLMRHAHDDFERKQLATLKRQLVRMDELVTSVLDAARLDDGRVLLRRERVDLRAFVEAITDEWVVARPDWRFELATRPREIAVDIDRERIRQVIDNLLSNAVKYGGARRLVEIEVDRGDDEAWISVRDHGEGIAPAELQRIFDRFHRAKHGGRGHGLGLYIATALARLHGGSISVQSKLGAGSTFVLALPLARGAVPSSS